MSGQAAAADPAPLRGRNVHFDDVSLPGAAMVRARQAENEIAVDNMLSAPAVPVSTAIRPGRYNVWGTVIGVYFVAVAVSGLILLGADYWVQPLFNGAVLVLAVGLATASGRARARREAKQLRN